MGPKKMSLKEFYADESLGGSWADDDIDLSSISVPIEKLHHEQQRMGSSMSYGSPMGHHYGAGSITDMGPPYIVKLSNLPVNASDSFITDMFKSRFMTTKKFKILVDPSSNVLETRIIKKISFVELASSMELNKVLKWHDLYYGPNKKVFVELANFDDFKHSLEFNSAHQTEITEIESDFFSNRSSFRKPVAPSNAQPTEHLPPKSQSLPSPTQERRKSNPFGNAKPVDTLKKQLEIDKILDHSAINHTTFKTLGDGAGKDDVPMSPKRKSVSSPLKQSVPLPMKLEPHPEIKPQPKEPLEPATIPTTTITPAPAITTNSSSHTLTHTKKLTMTSPRKTNTRMKEDDKKTLVTPEEPISPWDKSLASKIASKLSPSASPSPSQSPRNKTISTLTSSTVRTNSQLKEELKKEPKKIVKILKRKVPDLTLKESEGKTDVLKTKQESDILASETRDELAKEVLEEPSNATPEKSKDTDAVGTQPISLPVDSNIQEEIDNKLKQIQDQIDQQNSHLPSIPNFQGGSPLKQQISPQVLLSSPQSQQHSNGKLFQQIPIPHYAIHPNQFGKHYQQPYINNKYQQQQQAQVQMVNTQNHHPIYSRIGNGSTPSYPPPHTQMPGFGNGNVPYGLRSPKKVDYELSQVDGTSPQRPMPQKSFNPTPNDPNMYSAKQPKPTKPNFGQSQASVIKPVSDSSSPVRPKTEELLVSEENKKLDNSEEAKLKDDTESISRSSSKSNRNSREVTKDIKPRVRANSTRKSFDKVNSKDNTRKEQQEEPIDLTSRSDRSAKPPRESKGPESEYNVKPTDTAIPRDRISTRGRGGSRGRGSLKPRSTYIRKSDTNSSTSLASKDGEENGNTDKSASISIENTPPVQDASVRDYPQNGQPKKDKKDRKDNRSQKGSKESSPSKSTNTTESTVARPVEAKNTRGPPKGKSREMSKDKSPDFKKEEAPNVSEPKDKSSNNGLSPDSKTERSPVAPKEGQEDSTHAQSDETNGIGSTTNNGEAIRGGRGGLRGRGRGRGRGAFRGKAQNYNQHYVRDKSKLTATIVAPTSTSAPSEV